MLQGTKKKCGEINNVRERVRHRQRPQREVSTEDQRWTFVVTQAAQPVQVEFRFLITSVEGVR